MNTYIKDVVNRLSRFSEKLENTSLFIEKPWVLIDQETNYHKYIFKRDGELVMSVNGEVQIGKWEYISGAKSILIDRITDKVLLNQFFFDSAVMALQIDGRNDQMMLLANETIIPDLDVKKYLQSLTYKKYNVITGILENGKTLEIYRGSTTPNNYVGKRATIDGNLVEDGKFKLQRTERVVEIRSGKVFKITSTCQYKATKGLLLTIEQVSEERISVGDFVYIGDIAAQTGKYKLGFMHVLHVVNGVVTKISFI